MEAYCQTCDNMVNVEVREKRELYRVKGEDISIKANVAYCIKCDEKLYNKELDSENLKQAYALYRTKNDLVSPDEVKEIRNQYGLSQKSLSLLLRWGEVTINRYENGSVPDFAHNEVLQFIKEPRNMERIYQRNSGYISLADRKKLKLCLEHLLREEEQRHFEECFESSISSNFQIGEYTGYTKYNLNKLENVFIRICELCGGCFKTKALKIAWYIDFYNFHVQTVSITGSPYARIPLGPVPEKYRLILPNMVEKGLLDCEEVEFEDGNTSSKFTAGDTYDSTLFNKSEIAIIDKVIMTLRKYSGRELIDRTHKEKAYLKTRENEFISYKYAENIQLSFE